ncbi:DeoR family transcriptional regulator [Tsukamurella pulmonis]|uniref:DNA-binding transcriptional regulator of sugar metabolism, DeoR/GlpR family n=1 Tax=Tsukamurella pulmonis TaxID=47312 RepID=A0A1H1GWI3_9ACTN|nr:DeoR/GlpR family DNA-binding transcription regulator [Tsukamurella pulmonis]KXO88206.1 DeoR family transcriptional regulator [Tsukamurella pulmonis]KXP13177.1 DeoR family transcriptional regulator [Tsukamurella pulmonis]RDH12473.1 DeoR/GlpR transcriptional regulator [Tsukamurella pulmonis]SDR17499.1 DNA-binding transcriptional regulator of sugar metabolism, DeoR/GlpR family [Tsukamurella pulmonis]SUP16466.1 Lactose phosphotransferase system repressor [Tsukamurella pulmonis]
MLAAERRRYILAAAVARGAVRVIDLAESLDVSEMTIRRDLDRLEEAGELTKVHGGAVRTGASAAARGSEPMSAHKAERDTAEKRAIATTAAALVEDGMTVAIGAGTTTLELARLLRGRPIAVVTNSISIFHVLTDPTGDMMDGSAVQLTGGQRTPSDALVGPVANAMLERVRCDRAFLGTHGIDPTAGFTSPNIGEAETNRRLIGTARVTHMLADHTKFGEIGAHLFAEFSAVGGLITDAGLGPAAREALADVLALTIANGGPE